jgi:DNA-binding MarR family transcriptional regulator
MFMFTTETALDGLLATLQDCDLSPLELRMLLWLAQHQEATQSELTRALGAGSDELGRAARRLGMRGLISRRFEGGSRSRFVLCISPAGLATVSPLVDRMARSQTQSKEMSR